MNLSIISKDKSSLLNKLSGFFVDHKQIATSISKFSHKKYVIRSEDGSKPVYRGSEVIAKTPISVTRIRNLLNIIVKRGNIKIVKNEKGD